MPSDANKHPNNATDKLIKKTLVFKTNHVDTNIKQQIIDFSNSIWNQNSYLYKEKLHTKKHELWWMPHTSSVFSEIFIVLNILMLLKC